MNEQQYEVITRNLKTTIDNQIKLFNKIEALQKSVATMIENQRIMGDDQNTLLKDVAELKKAITKP